MYSGSGRSINSVFDRDIDMYMASHIDIDGCIDIDRDIVIYSGSVTHTGIYIDIASCIDMASGSDRDMCSASGIGCARIGVL